MPSFPAGTYLKPPAYYGNDNPDLSVTTCPVGKDRTSPCVVLNIGLVEKDMSKGRHAFTLEELLSCPNANEVSGATRSCGTGWGRYWMDPAYLEAALILPRTRWTGFS
jgi:hypothetical protein